MQIAEPIAVLYVPARHAVQGPPFGPVKPRLHVQAAIAMLAAGELEAVGHAAQVAFPVWFLYVVIAQAVHVPPFWPV